VTSKAARCSARFASAELVRLLFFLLQAQSSKARSSGLANAGLDTTNSIKQAAEFGIVKGGPEAWPGAGLMTLSEVHGLGLRQPRPDPHGRVLLGPRRQDPRVQRALSSRRTGHMPSMIHAGTYSATLSYLKAVKAAGTKDSEAVVKKLKELPVDDAFAKARSWRTAAWCMTSICSRSRSHPNPRSHGTTTSSSRRPGDKAFFAAKDSGCPLTK